MKKFDIKKLMLLMLALLMVFALVACDKEAGTDGNNRDIVDVDDVVELGKGYITAEQYFTALWSASESLGKDTYTSTDDIKLNLDLNVKLATGTDTVVDLGVNLGIVYDRAASAYTWKQDNEGIWGKIGESYYSLGAGYRAYAAATDEGATRYSRAADKDNKKYVYTEAADGAYVYDTVSKYYVSKSGDKADDIFVAEASRYVKVTSDTNVGNKTAAMVKLYDHDNANNWLTLYYFVADPYSAYVQFKDQQVKVSFDTGFNDTYQAVIANFLDATGLIKNKTIADIVDAVFAKGSDNKWNLDDLVFSVVDLLGLDLDSLLATVGKFLNIKFESGATSLLPVLNKAGGLLLPLDEKKGTSACTKTERAAELGGGYTYTGKIAPKLLVTLLGDLTDGLITNGLDLRLIFNTTVENNVEAIDGFKITAKIPKNAYSGTKDLNVEIGINDVTIEKLGEKTAAQALGVDTSKFSDKFDLSLKLGIGIKNNALVVNPDPGKIDLDGYYELQLNGFVDLANHGAANNTAAYASIKYGANASAALALVAEASYSKQSTAAGYDGFGILALKLYDDVKFNDTSSTSVVEAFAENIAPMIINALAGVKDATVQGVAVGIFQALYKEADNTPAAIKAIYAASNAKVGEKIGTYTQVSGTPVAGNYYKNEKEEMVAADAAYIAANAGVTYYTADLYTQEQIDAAKAKYAYEDNNITGLVIKNIDLVKLFTGLFKGEPSYNVAAGSAEAEAAADLKWDLNITKLVGAIVKALSNNNGVITVSVSDVGATIASIFANDEAAKNVSKNEMLFGNSDRSIKGWFSSNGSAVGTWWSTFFKGSAWATNDDEKATIEGLFESDAVITVNNKAGNATDKGTINVTATNGDAEIAISLLLNITAETSYKTYGKVVVPTAINDAYATGGYASEADGVWLVANVETVA